MPAKSSFFPQKSIPDAYSRPEIPLTIKYLRELQGSPPSAQLKTLLSNFAQPKAIDYKTFREGVKKFIELANTNPVAGGPEKTDREALYGNRYAGLHYSNDLARMWNARGSDKTGAHDLTGIVPPELEYSFEDGLMTIIYRGQQPAQALDTLIKGPSVIDCGMFAELSLWFGIRYMLGNERFNQCFGRTPFFITQTVYNRMSHGSKQNHGNPLYAFLSPVKTVPFETVIVRHIANSPLYPLKHPGENYGGENCIVMDGEYHIFDPCLPCIQPLTEMNVKNILRYQFNIERTVADSERISLYAKNPGAMNPRFSMSYETLIGLADNLAEKQLTEEEFNQIEQSPELEHAFDLDKFSRWLHTLEQNSQTEELPDYVPQSIDYTQIPLELLEALPFENRKTMDFSTFRADTPQQRELANLSRQFCNSIMTMESRLLILTGKTGVGKTASAACAAKELATRGKKVTWISEVMVKGWADKVQSIEELDNCGLAIDALLAENPDAVFLDDDNLSGFSGNLLLEKIYAWYAKNPGKGLYITSNEPVSFKKCYGHKLDGYQPPPFTHYDSPQYLNWQVRENLGGSSLRSRKDGQSIGAIVNEAIFERQKEHLIDFELVPAFDVDSEMVPISQALRAGKAIHACEAYQRLKPIQKKWLDVFKTAGYYRSTYGSGGYRPIYEPPHWSVAPLKFEKTSCKTIALELMEYNSQYSGKSINSDCMEQLLRILNYVHDQGGRRLILINKTSYSPEEFLAQIKKHLPKAEKERTWSRLMLLLCETDETIFGFDEFNGRMENLVSEKPLPVLKDKNINPLPVSPTGGLRQSNSAREKFRKDFSIKECYHEELMKIALDISTDDDMYCSSDKITDWPVSLIPMLYLVLCVINRSIDERQETIKPVDSQEQPETAMKNDFEIPGTFFAQRLRRQEEAFLIEHRHENPELQHAYDRRFGMIPR